MSNKKIKQTHNGKQHRPGWQGLLTFGLVSFPVQAFNALDPEGGNIHFHQLHAKCHSRIQYKKVCPIHGEVSNDEIVSGYEVSKGEYVEMKPEELEALRSESDRAFKIDAFLSLETVDPLYFDGRMYYLTPSGSTSDEPYTVIVEAMAQENRYGVGRLVFSGKDQLALVRPLEGVLHMAMLHYEAEIRPPESVAGSIKKPKGLAQQMKLAQTLVTQWSQDHFDFSSYQDSYRESVHELIESKKKGRVITPPKEEKPAKVLNLNGGFEEEHRQPV